jgi:hypothetical protein
LWRLQMTPIKLAVRWTHEGKDAYTGSRI